MRRTFRRALASPIEPAPNRLCDRAVAAGHVVTMTIDWSTIESVGTCQCGVMFRVHRDGTTPETNLMRVVEMNRAIEAHWREVLQEPAP